MRMEPMMWLANDGAAKTDFSRGVTFCPCCGPEGNNPAEDPGETMEHASDETLLIRDCGGAGLLPAAKLQSD